MKQEHVKEGSVYLTRVSGQLVPVRVVSVVCGVGRNLQTTRRRFRLARADGGGGSLTKLRSAAALREIPWTVVRMKGQTWDVGVRQLFDAQPRFGLKAYEAQIPEWSYHLVLEAPNPIAAAVYAARACVARAVWGEMDLELLQGDAVELPL